jgi:hypothetical protein
MRAERALDVREVERIWELIPARARPQESLDEAFFRCAVELAVLLHKLSLPPSRFEALVHAEILDPVIRRQGAEGLVVSWTWQEDDELELPLPA